jgi:hypothetical protein
MSRNLFTILGSLKLKWNNYYLIGPPIHFGYSYFTQKNRNIMVSDKYTFDSNGFTNFMIVDTENNHYKVGNNLWFWKWDSIEDWTLLKTGTKIPVLYYGFRVPFFGIFPNVFNINYNNINTNTNTNKTKNRFNSDDIKDILTTPKVTIMTISKPKVTISNFSNSIITANALITANACAK